MLLPSLKNYLESEISALINAKVTVLSVQPAVGGCINNTYVLTTSAGMFFIKTNNAKLYPGMFEKEARGLEKLSEAGVIIVPKPLIQGEIDNTSFLLLEHIEPSRPKPYFWEDFGYSLAGLHRYSSEFFGLEYNNYIGSLEQSNRKHNNWISFFIEERLEPLIKQAIDTNKADQGIIRDFSVLFSKLETIIPQESPSLVHGDLWNGNYMVSSSGEPCLIDPAIYYGHREMDIAMSKLFGGFSGEFYSAYNNEFPMESDWNRRIDVCNLYPLMVHVNLFGGSYLQSVKRILRDFI
jgi:protein-ribulosamine 3-kinase